MAFTSAESSTRKPKFVVDVKQITLTIPTGAKTTALINIPAELNGQFVEMQYVCPDLNDDATFKLEVLTPDGSALTGALLDALTENTTGIIFIIDTLRRFLTGQEKIRASCATDQTDDREIDVQFKVTSIGV